MILPFIIDLQIAGYDGKGNYDHLPVFYFYLDMIKNRKGPIIAHERYFSNPNAIQGIEKIKAFGLEMGYSIPSIEDLKSIGQYTIPQDFEDELISDYPTQIDCWKDILWHENKKLDIFIRKLFSKIEADYNEKIEAVLCFYAPASLRKIAAEKGIYVIFNERTSFRPPLFISSGYFDFKENYRKGELEERYNKFLEETKENPVVLFERKEILSLFMTSKGLNYLDCIDSIQPSKELGICRCGEEMIPLEQSLFTTNQLSLEAQKLYLPENIVYRDRTNSQTSIEFILSCRRIASVHSNMSFDTMLLGRTSCSYGNSPFAFMANNGIKDFKENIVPIEFINFVVFGYFVPWQFLRDEEYIRWRLTKPSEIEIYKKHLSYYLTQRGLDLSIFQQNKDDRLEVILKNQNVKLNATIKNHFTGSATGSYRLETNFLDNADGVLFENFYSME